MPDHPAAVAQDVHDLALPLIEEVNEDGLSETDDDSGSVYSMQSVQSYNEVKVADDASEVSDVTDEEEVAFGSPFELVDDGDLADVESLDDEDDQMGFAPGFEADDEVAEAINRIHSGTKPWKIRAMLKKAYQSQTGRRKHNGYFDQNGVIVTNVTHSSKSSLAAGTLHSIKKAMKEAHKSGKAKGRK